MTKHAETSKPSAVAAAAVKESPRETVEELIRLAEGAAQECRSRSMRRTENFLAAFAKALKKHGA